MIGFIGVSNIRRSFVSIDDDNKLFRLLPICKALLRVSASWHKYVRDFAFSKEDWSNALLFFMLFFKGKGGSIKICSLGAILISYIYIQVYIHGG